MAFYSSLFFFTGSIGTEYVPAMFTAFRIAVSDVNNIIKYAGQYQQSLCFLNARNESTLRTEKPVTFIRIISCIRACNAEFPELYEMHEQTESERRVTKT